MKLKSLLFPNLIKMLIIKDGILKIEKFNGSIKEFEISEILKIHIVNRSKNNRFINLFTIIAVLSFLYYIGNLKILLLLISLFTSIAVVFMVSAKNKPKIIYFKFKNKSTYYVKFDNEIRDLALKIIREIRKNNNI